MRYFYCLTTILATLLASSVAVGQNLAAAEQGVAALSGTYQIGGGGADFATISEAVDSLVAGGILSPVTFQISAGTYDEQVSIGAFTRFGGVNDVVTFQPLGGTVTWNYTSATSVDDYFVKIVDADHITFSDLVFDVPQIASTDVGTIFELSNTDGITIDNCQLNGLVTADRGQPLIETTDAPNNNVTLTNSRLVGGFQALDLDTGATGSVATISGNTMRRQLSGAMKARTNDVTLEDNVIHDTTDTIDSSHLVWIIGTDPQVRRNRLDLEAGTTALNLFSFSSTGGFISNNMVGVRSPNAVAGVSMDRGTFVNNTVVVGPTSNSRTMDVQGSDVFLFNNLLVNLAGNDALFVETPLTSTFFSNNNNIYNDGGPTLVRVSVTTYADLNAYRTATDRDTNSVSVDVAFTDTSAAAPFELTLPSYNFDVLAPTYPGITDDIDGTARGVTRSYMGAHEASDAEPMTNSESLNGTIYRVGGSNPRDFGNPSEAIDHLNGRGVKGPVTLNIRFGPGIWPVHKKVRFERYGGLSDDLIVIKAANPNNRPTLTHTASSADSNYVLAIDTVSHVTVQRLKFLTDSPGGFGRAIRILDSENVTIDDCEITAPFSLATDNQLIQADGDVANLRVINSTLTDGRVGIAVETSSSGVEIEGNTLVNQVANGIIVSDAFDPNVIGNTITGGPNTPIELFLTRQGTVRGNTLDVSSGGIMMGAVDGGLNGEFATVANNFCNALVYCVLVVGSDSVDVVHNTLLIDSPASTSGPVTTSTISASADVSVRNNILLRANGAGPLIYSPDGAVSVADWNNHFNGVGFEANIGGTTYTTLVDYRNGTGFGANSVSKSVTFVDESVADLHLTGGSDGDVDLQAAYDPDIATDYDGDARSNLSPHMGADEPSNNFGFGLELSLTALLEGSFATGLALRDGGHLEAHARHHPYGGAPWFYAGTDSVGPGEFAGIDVVDWVYVELYDGTLPAISFETSKVGLLLADGSIVDPLHPTRPLIFEPATGGSYYPAVYHRNHIAVIASSPVEYSPPSVFINEYDFTDGAAYTTGPAPMKLLGGRHRLFAADGSGDGQVTASDFNEWLVKTKAGATGYELSDFNMDGQVTAADFNVWLVNTKAGAASEIP